MHVRSFGAGLLAAIAFASSAASAFAEDSPGIEIIGPAPAEGREHLKVPHARVRVVNRLSFSLFYRASGGRDGFIVETETKVSGRWISSSVTICGTGFEWYELKPGEALEQTIPVLPPMYGRSDRATLNECPVRFRFDCARAKDGNGSVSLFSDEHAPFLLPDPASRPVEAPAAAADVPTPGGVH